MEGPTDLWDRVEPAPDHCAKGNRDDNERDNSTPGTRPAMAGQAGPDEGRADTVEVDGGEQHPERHGSGDERESIVLGAEQQDEDCHVEQDQELRSDQLVANELPAGDRGREEVVHLRRCVDQDRLVAAEHPSPRHHAGESDGHEDGRPLPRQRAGTNCGAVGLNEKEPQIERPEQQGQGIARVRELGDLQAEAVRDCLNDQVAQGPGHPGGASTFPVRVRKTSSSGRPASAGWLAMISEIVPKATSRPRCMIRTRVQTSSTM